MNQPKDAPQTASKVEQSKEFKKDRVRVMNMLTKDVSLDQDYVNVKNDETKTIAEIDKRIKDTNVIKANANAALTEQIKSVVAEIQKKKNEILNNEQSMKDAKTQFDENKAKLINEFNIKRDQILKESKEVEAQLNHYAEWQQQSGAYQTRLAELKSKIHQNRITSSEAIAQSHKNEQARIDKHRIELAEAIRKARAESLRLRSGDISEQSTTFLTQSEQQVQNLQQQLESSQHLAEVNETIEDDNMSMRQEIKRLKTKTERLRDQEEKQINVVAKLKAIQKEFKDKEKSDALEKKKIKKRELIEKKKIAEEEARKKPKPKPEFKMSAEQEAFFTFLTECSTTVRSVLKQINGKDVNTPVTPKNDRFEAPKLVAMIEEIKEMTNLLSSRPQSNLKEKRSILTPAAAYFAFSAPFDDGDEFIKSENWSFSKYEACKPTTATKKTQPKIVRIKTGTKTPIV